MFNTTLTIPTDALPGPDVLQLQLVSTSSSTSSTSSSTSSTGGSTRGLSGTEVVDTLTTVPIVVADPRPPTVDMQVGVGLMECMVGLCTVG